MIDRASRHAPAALRSLLRGGRAGLLSDQASSAPDQPRLAGKRRNRVLPLILAGQLALGLAVAATTGLLVVHLHDHALEVARDGLRAQALILADQAERAFDAVDVLQTALLERFQTLNVHTVEDVERILSIEQVHQLLRGRKAPLPQLDGIAIIDAAGNMINNARPVRPVNINVADRDYFQVLKGNPGQTSFVGEPAPSRVTNTWTIYQARKIVGTDGTFMGMIVGAIQLDYFEQLYRSVASGPGTSISLFRRDGVLLARYPHVQPRVGQSFAKSDIFRVLQETGLPAVHLRRLDEVDGVDRLIAVHTLEHRPLLVTVTSTIASILEEWQRLATYLVVGAIFLEAVLVAVGVLMLRQLRNQRLLTAAHAARATAEASLVMAQEKARTGREMGVQNVRFSAALSNMSQALCMFDSADSLIVGNARLAEMFGIPEAAIAPGVTLDDLLASSAAASGMQMGDLDAMRGAIGQLKAEARRGLASRDLIDGRTLAISFAPVADAGWLVTLEDVTDQRRAEARLIHMAHHDALTGLPNRVRFRDRLSDAIARSRRGEACAVLLLDLDRFKAVNDTLGHPVGDVLLRQVTHRLQGQLRETDTVARLGGDEFAIVQSSVAQPEDSITLASRLIEAIGEPYLLDDHHIIIGTSIGIALVPADGDDPDQILRNADMALYQAKAEGRGRFRFFEESMKAKVQARRCLEMDLRNALETNAFEMFYQPLIDVRTRMVCGFEALLRWNHPLRGLVSPAEFVPLAEEIGLIIPLGKWIIRQAFADAAAWPRPVKVAVNLSPAQFVSRTLVADVASALEASGLPPSRLEFEITETVMLEDTEAALSVLHRLRDLGIAIALDDFGTGYSSLSYLRRFPFSKVKIDRSFIKGLGEGGDSDAIVTAVISLCNTLGMTTTAEGVETEAQLQELRARRCDQAQGYLFSPARPAHEVAALCARLDREAAAEQAAVAERAAFAVQAA